MNTQVKGYLFGILAAFFWGIHAVGVRYLSNDIPGIVIAEFRVLGASFFFFIFLLLRRTKISFRPVNIKWFLLVVLLGMCVNTVSFHWGLKYTTASAAILIESSAPVFVLLFLALFFKERLKNIEILAVIVTFFGLILISRSNLGDSLGQGSWFGIMLELIAGITWGIFFLGSSKFFAKANTLNQRIMNLFILFFTCAIILLPTLFAFDYSLTVKDTIIILIMALFPSTLAFACWYEAASRLSTITATLLFNLSIIFTMINSVIFNKESFTLTMIIGSVLIIAGVSITKIKSE